MGPPQPLAQATTTQPRATLHASLDSISYTQASKVLQGGNMYLLLLRRWEIPKTHSHPMAKATSQSTTLVVWGVIQSTLKILGLKLGMKLGTI